MNGRFALYYDAVDGKRYPIDTAIWELSVPARTDEATPGESAPVTFTPPTSPSPRKPGIYLLVFTGQMGDEGPEDGSRGAVVVREIGNKAIAMGVGHGHSIVVKTDGTAWAFGRNHVGQLGNGDVSDGASLGPTGVVGVDDFVAVTGGDDFSLGVRSDGTVWAWGANYYGQLGMGAFSDAAHPNPARVTGLTGVTSVAAGWAHALALKSDGTVWAWGLNRFGQLGNGSSTGSGPDESVATPAMVPGLSDIVAIAAGAESSYALKRDGSVWSWGASAAGQLGDGTLPTTWLAHRPSAQPVVGLSGVTAIAASHLSAYALTSLGTIWGWGVNTSGQLGTGSYGTETAPCSFYGNGIAIPFPVQAVGLVGATGIAAGGGLYIGGSGHAIAITSGGHLMSWGGNCSGQLGNGTVAQSMPGVQPLPGPVVGLDEVMTVVSTTDHSLALRSDGTVWGWGNNTWGKLGTGASGNYPVPMLIPGFGDGM